MFGGLTWRLLGHAPTSLHIRLIFLFTKLSIKKTDNKKYFLVITLQVYGRHVKHACRARSWSVKLKLHVLACMFDVYIVDLQCDGEM